ncbi:type 4 pilus major pilin [Paraburkholderia megapolitana]|uniref:type 4 pilus major pilin n=1 Tax=Paraburkholderia megapolitana TaxID=420953 RepID=UPI0038BA5430
MGELLGTWYGKLLMLLGIAAVAGVMLVASSGSKVASQASDITMLQGNARQQLGASQNGYTNFTTANSAGLIQAGVVPPGMVRAGALTDQWGGAITFAPANNGAQGVVTLAGITSVKDCTKLATTLRDYDTLIIGKVTFTPDQQPDGSTAGAACNGNNTVQITFS